MALEKPLWMQPSSGDAAITYSAQQDRAGLLSTVFSREGVLDPDAGQLKISQRSAGANFSIDVAAGRCAIVGDDASDQGTYLCTSTTVLNIATPTKPASGSRRHRVIARVKDKLHNGSWTTYEWTIEILQDTGSGAPAQPNSAITLGFVNMTSTMTSVLNANLETDRPRAVVGTPAQSGTLTVNPANWAANDANRPITWQLNPDGWVMLSGFVRYVGSSFTWTPTLGGAAGEPLWGFSGVIESLPAAIKPVGYRDTVVASSFGVRQFTSHPNNNNNLCIYLPESVNFVQNQTWISLDGCGWRV